MRRNPTSDHRANPVEYPYLHVLISHVSPLTLLELVPNTQRQHLVLSCSGLVVAELVVGLEGDIPGGLYVRPNVVIRRASVASSGVPAAALAWVS